MAATKSVAAFASNEQRHVSSSAFSDIGWHQVSDAKYLLHFSLQLTCGTPIVVICFIPEGNKRGPSRLDGSLCSRHRCRLVLRCGQATAPRSARRFQDDRAARGLAWRQVIAAFDAPPDAD